MKLKSKFTILILVLGGIAMGVTALKSLETTDGELSSVIDDSAGLDPIGDVGTGHDDVGTGSDHSRVHSGVHMTRSVEAWVAYSDLVVRIHPVQIQSGRYNTEDGVMPSPGPTPPEADEYLAFEEFAPAVADVDHVFTSTLATNVDGLVLYKKLYPGDEWSNPEDALFTMGDTDFGVLMLEEVPSGLRLPTPTTELSPWIEVLFNKEQELSASGDEYRYMRVLNFYKYSNGVAESYLDGTSMSTSQLEAEIVAASN